MDRVVIDASSLIYASKAEFLQLLKGELHLCSSPDVLIEAGEALSAGVEAIESPVADTNDQSLLETARSCHLPLISEDGKLLKQCRQESLEYYNSLMLLNLLLFRERLSLEVFVEKRSLLQQTARYQKWIWTYGDAVTMHIVDRQIRIKNSAHPG